MRRLWNWVAGLFRKRPVEGSLEDLIYKTRGYKMSSEEYKAQARSFVMGNLRLDGVEVTDEQLAQVQADLDPPYIRSKQ